MSVLHAGVARGRSVLHAVQEAGAAGAAAFRTAQEGPEGSCRCPLCHVHAASAHAFSSGVGKGPVASPLPGSLPGVGPGIQGPGTLCRLLQGAEGALAALNASRRLPKNVSADLKEAIHKTLGASLSLPASMLDGIERRLRELSATPSVPVSPSEAAEMLQLARASYAQGQYHDCHQFAGAVAQATGSPDALLLLGSACYQMGQYLDCVAVMEKARAKGGPVAAEFCFNMANALQQLGEVDTAIHVYMECIGANPEFTDAYNNTAMCFTSKGAPQLALLCYELVLQIQPELYVVHHNVGHLWLSQGTAGNGIAQQSFALSLHCNPNYAPAWSGLGQALLESCTCPEHHQMLSADIAICFNQALSLDGHNIGAYLGLATNHEMLGRTVESLCLLREAVRLAPQNPECLSRLCSSLIKAGLWEDALEACQQAVLLDPSHVEALNNMGNVLRGLGRVTEAGACYQRCINLMDTSASEAGKPSPPPNFYCKLRDLKLPVLYNNLGGVLKIQGKVMEAMACYQKVVQLNPNVAAAFTNLGSCQKELGLHEEAITTFMRALTLQPNFAEAACSLFHSRQSICCWDDHKRRLAQLVRCISESLSQGALPCVQPFHCIAYPLPTDMVLNIARAYAVHARLVATKRGTVAPLQPALPYPRALLPKGRLRIGYVSSDFGNHPLSHLMQSVWGLHDRSRFEIFLYALTPSDGSSFRARAEHDADRFVDCSGLNDAAIAEAIHTDGIHIALNLNGYTKGARTEVFALSPAPIQAAYMGFPGTMGADYIPYLISDSVVAPLQTHHCYSEALALMPNSYFVNDYKQSGPRTAAMGWDGSAPACRVATPEGLSRSSFGLPENAVVFYCCNQMYKIDPDTFSSWCSILRRVPKSVLWLLRFPPAGEANLRREAGRQGIPADRLVFSEVTNKEEHIQRSALADIALDTPYCNAHTSACDVLWAGVPLITLPLQLMASRVAASLCVAVGCPELVVKNQDEYKELAVALGNNPDRLRALRVSLRKKRLASPLFDTARWVRDVEKVYDRMWEIHAAGEAPRTFKID